ncbi:protein translocase subunit SecF [Clostridium paraputrificum]|uniref:protein translocase subunit SecF n=1 Tax=Clostridium TaxID=1485 RepID=UPI003D34A8E8
MLKIIEKTKVWFALSLVVILIGLGFAVTKGFNLGIDFKGGTQVTLELGNDYDKSKADEIVSKYTNNFVTNTIGDDANQFEIKSGDLDSLKVKEIIEELKTEFSLDGEILVDQNEIGASVGDELKRNSIIALVISFFAMLIYIAIRFEINFGIAALIALVHDIVITLCVYAIFGIQINTPFIAAILTIIGYSMNDTIVIFDRIRENYKKSRRADLVEVANASITQTMSRSIITTITTLSTIIAVNIFVPAVREFAFPLIIGIACGAYSSIFIASPVWIILKKREKRKLK